MTQVHFDTITRKLYHARLMSEQVAIDSLEFARQGKRLQGDVAVASMGRLQEHLHSNSGVLHYILSGKVSEKGRLHLVCEVNGKLALICQRCLGALDFPLVIESTLELVKEGEEFLPLEDEEESVDTIPADAAMDVLALVEEEVLLNLPIAPMHDSVECAASGSLQPLSSGKPNPFAVLASLKKDG